MSEIWILDDDRSVRFVLAEAMRDAGYTVRDFDNARAALSVLAHAEPNVVFTDVRMPGTGDRHDVNVSPRLEPVRGGTRLGLAIARREFVARRELDRRQALRGARRRRRQQGASQQCGERIRETRFLHGCSRAWGGMA